MSQDSPLLLETENLEKVTVEVPVSFSFFLFLIYKMGGGARANTHTHTHTHTYWSSGFSTNRVGSLRFQVKIVVA